MQKSEQFTPLFTQLVAEMGYTPGQLATRSGVPKSTVVNWLNGRVRRPRHWDTIVQVATAMRLSERDTNRLLSAAQHPSLTELRQTDESSDLFTFWEAETDIPFTPTLPSLSPPFQVIPRLTPFVGRESELTQLIAWLKEAEPLPMLLYGMSGIGKTAVVAELAYRLRASFPDGVLWARLDTSPTSAILQTFADAYGRDLTMYPDVASRSRLVRTLLQEKQVLLILDNAESSEQVEPLLPASGKCAVLITSQRRNLLPLSGLRRLEIRPFAPDGEALPHLFQQILGEAWWQTEADAITAIAEQLGYHPLALAIVANRLAHEPGWTLATFQARLESAPLSALQVENKGVHATLSLIYDGLSEKEQSILQAGCCCGDHFDEAIISGITQLPIIMITDLLRQLLLLSLLQLSATPNRYQLHPLLRTFVREKGTGQFEKRIVTYFIHWLKEARLTETNLRDEQNNLVTVFNLAYEKGWGTLLLAGVLAVVPWWIMYGFYAMAAEWLERATQIAVTQEAKHAEAHLYRYQGQLARQQQAWQTAVTALERCAQLVEALADADLQAICLVEQGVLAACQEDREKAFRLLTFALPHLRQMGLVAGNDNAPLLIALEELGIIAIFENRADEAERHYQEALAIARAQQNDLYTVRLLKSLGTLFYLRGEKNLGHAYFKEGWALAEEIRYPLGMIALLNNRAVVAFAIGEDETAVTHLQQGLTMAENLGHRRSQEQLQRNLTLLAEEKGKPTSARRRLRLFL